MSGGFEEMAHGVCSFVSFGFLVVFVTCYDLIDIQQMLTDSLFLRTLVVTWSEKKQWGITGRYM